MKRFHVHAHVEDLQASVAFYAKLFGAPPTRLESDYAKWMRGRGCAAAVGRVCDRAGPRVGAL